MIPRVNLSQRDYIHQLKVTKSHGEFILLYRKLQTMEKRLWDIREKWSKELVFTVIGKSK